MRDPFLGRRGDMRKHPLPPPETTSVILLLTVPRDWPALSVAEIERKLRHPLNDGMYRVIAEEIKKWGGTGTYDLTALRQFLEDRGAL